MWRILLGALAMLGIVTAAYLYGDKAGYARRDATAQHEARLAAETHVKALQVAGIIASNIDHQVAGTIERTRTFTNTIRERVPDYVPPAADARCVVPGGFVQLHDAAAAGAEPADPTRFADKTIDSGLALSAVAGTVAENYGTCHEWRAVAQGWQDWYAQTCKALGSCPAPPAVDVQH